MFATFFRFELNYWLRSMMVYVFLIIIWAIVLGATSSDNVQIGGSLENAKRNSPYTIQFMYASLSVISVVMTAAFANGAASRDFMYDTHQILFTKPINKLSYVFGRFGGAALVAVVPMFGVSLGILLAEHMPWVESENWGPIYWSAHLWSMIAIAIPNAIITAALIFSVALYTRSTITAFIAAILLIVGAAIASSLVSNLDNRTLAALVNPFGYAAIADITRYWTVSDRNTKVVTLSGLLLANRLCWLAISLGVLGLAYWRFSFAERRVRNARGAKAARPTAAVTEIPLVTFRHDWTARIAQLRSQVRVDFWETVRSNVFIVLILVTLLNASVAVTLSAGEGFGLSSLPVTFNIVELLRGSMYAFLLGIIAFYTGVMVWKERDAKLDAVYDALPQSTWTIFLGKLIAMMIIVALVLCVGIVVGVIVQAASGYTRFQLGLYATEILVMDLLSMFFFVMLSMLAHVVSPNKYIGYFLFVILVITNSFVWSALEISTRMVRYGSLPNYIYSDMYGYSPYVESVIAFGVYWLLFATLVGFFCVLYWQRGKECHVRRRLAAVRGNFRGGLAGAAVATGVLWVLSAGWIFYNTMLRNELLGAAEQRDLQAQYEKDFKGKHENQTQPHVTKVNYSIDLYPERRALRLVGEQQIVNRSDQPISEIYLNFTEGMETTVEIDRASLKEAFEDLEYYIYEFSPPLQPDEELSMSYEVSYEPIGFENSLTRADIVDNGTFFNNTIAPQIGYQTGAELTNKGDRKEKGLSETQNLMPVLNPDDDWNRRQTYLSGINEWVEVETVISTTNDLAVAPGSLIRRWEEDGRNYFHYKVDHPSLNFYSFVSADYKVATNRWNDVDIEVYYHPEHEWNVENMLRSIRDSLVYYSENFGPYKHKQARIIEFPRISSFAQAFPGTMPYSEGIGFIADIKETDDIDMVYYVVAHEMAHQWWAHQVVGSNMQGSTLLSETLAQYSALMVMEQAYGRDMMRKFLQYEMDSYLRSRGLEQLKERPLISVEATQGYIHYRKGSCVMYYLKEMIGEDKINEVLRGLVDKFGYQEPPYPTSLDLLDGLRGVTPPELQYLLNDLFEEITLFANRTESATYEELDDGKFRITLDVVCEKFHADGKGGETSKELDDWIEIGAFAKPKNGRRFGDTLHRERKKITSRDSKFEFVVDRLPAKVGVDPFALLIDRMPGDNMKKPTRAN